MGDKGEDAHTTPLPAGMPTRHDDVVWWSLAFIGGDRLATPSEHEL